MKLFVSLSGSSVNELTFDRGPIYVGRQKGSQVFLPDPAVSRQHAVFYTTKDGAWIIEDLGSANKTFLNRVAIHKAEIKTGDTIQIADFEIRVQLDEEGNHAAEISEKDDTLVGTQIRKELHTVERNLDAADAPPIRFPAKRVRQLTEVIDQICHERSLGKLHKILQEVLLRQFSGLHVWVALRREPSGPMEAEGGRKITTEAVQRVDLAVPNSLEEALEKHKFMLIHQLPRPIINRGIRSVLIAPVMYQKDCFGIFYIENSTEHSHYSLMDLDYLVLLALYTGILIQRLRET
ncbi:MAG TPA: FHA domain-containing protein [Anaerohalosphaeraceae bacterium]|nr:FHA domain-containing protein [Anaerohalosphaeraceae bacterium]HOQ04416.1 FHA domain-containing protein [Anaerohalosphaeraceae bacterium]HPP56338.1 FHA domain-containing protein [Anaerohalosphaeraceae bacterium]